jgi:hypothetical protein
MSKRPLPVRVSSERGDRGVVVKIKPLRLAFQAREGTVEWLGAGMEEIASPTRVSSKGGGRGMVMGVRPKIEVIKRKLV